MNSTTLLAVAAGLVAPLAAQTSQLTVPSSITATVGRILPERSNAGAAYLGADYSPNLVVTDPCQIQVVFFWESAGYRNSLGWFRYSESESEVTIHESGMLFPDVNQPGTLSPGAAIYIGDGQSARTFQAGDRIGFFIVADGWNTSSAVRNFTPGTAIPTTSPASNRTIGRGCYTTLPRLNPENIVGDGSRAQHVAMVRIPGVPGFLDGQELIVCGFEDLNRTANSDDDFNDAVFLFRVTPPDAIVQTQIAAFDPTDHDGDGKSGFDDAFPTDPDRTHITRIPSSGWSVIAFEDLYPGIGDADYNDAVVAIAYTLVSNRQNHVKDVIADFHLLARGASFDAQFGLNFHKLPPSVGGTVRMQRFDSGASVPTEIATQPLVAISDQGARIGGVFPSTTAAMPRAVPDKPFANTWPGHPSVPAASARVWVEFTAPVATALLGTAPYDPFLIVTADTGQVADIHLPGLNGFLDRAENLPSERGNNAFLDDQGKPWAVVVPTNWRFPMEGVPITVAYPDFAEWGNSRGRNQRDWFVRPTSDESKLSSPIEELIPQRTWTLRGPSDRF
ncbi:MAG: LruC domain-containing protein [Planctomycetota bacterium]